MNQSWYVDARGGDDRADGRSEKTARRSWKTLDVQPGDTVLLRRGSVFEGGLLSPDGTPEAPIFWDAYGDGEAPVFCGSIALGQASKWQEQSPGIWRCTVPLRNEVCNLILDDGAAFGTLRWSADALTEPGDWYFSHFGCHGVIPDGETPQLLMCAPHNPAECWRTVDAAMFGARRLASAHHDVCFSNLTFRNSGAHGFATTEAARITLRDCRFERIGGCVWSLKRRIRFGNGVEFWNSTRDVRVEHCTFEEIYDSCVTHQGGGLYPTPERLTFSDNTFRRYGMAAYEIRDVIPFDAVFSGNRCEEAGLGFSAQGETRPRRSEIWPQPMGHHLFVWRIDAPTPGGSIRVTQNIFGSAPFGSTEYSIIAPEAERQIHFSGNRCTPEAPAQAAFRAGVYLPAAQLNTGAC